MKISENAKGCVVFFGVPSVSGGVAYGGTGFLVSVTEGELGFGYLVTCRHVAKALEDNGDFFIRMNAKNGTCEDVPAVSIDWRYSADLTVDIAVASIHFNLNKFDCFYFSIENNWLSPLDVCCGDLINIIGLFRLHFGSKRNLPIVHTGNIAMLPDLSEKIPLRDRKTGKTIESEAYLIEAQTLEGLSGSPVFVHETVALEGFVRLSDGRQPGAFGAVKLLGIYSGAWDAEPGKILEADRNLRGGLRVPVGIGIVVPAERLIELIMGDEKLKGHRKMVRDANTAGVASD